MTLGGPRLLGRQLAVHVHRTGEPARACHRQALSSRSASSRRSACLPRKIRIATWLRVTPSWRRDLLVAQVAVVAERQRDPVSLGQAPQRGPHPLLPFRRSAAVRERRRAGSLGGGAAASSSLRARTAGTRGAGAGGRRGSDGSSRSGASGRTGAPGRTGRSRGAAGGRPRSGRPRPRRGTRGGGDRGRARAGRTPGRARRAPPGLRRRARSTASGHLRHVHGPRRALRATAPGSYASPPEPAPPPVTSAAAPVRRTPRRGQPATDQGGLDACRSNAS